MSGRCWERVQRAPLTFGTGTTETIDTSSLKNAQRDRLDPYPTQSPSRATVLAQWQGRPQVRASDLRPLG